ncbi:hypothetical protein AVEN_242227-1 [Araneus ventricosus]|uniref:Uncharacterized protein n=1 Tax=Araneus ventricosus TaxID=182803 RepID=A0A4Y2FRH1_ARAVE|nr:hypothetical protein AVEN_242227-1 [Araneus ventricosus]
MQAVLCPYNWYSSCKGYREQGDFLSGRSPMSVCTNCNGYRSRDMGWRSVSSRPMSIQLVLVMVTGAETWSGSQARPCPSNWYGSCNGYRSTHMGWRSVRQAVLCPSNWYGSCNGYRSRDIGWRSVRQADGGLKRTLQIEDGYRSYPLAGLFTSIF